eukprot:gene12603-24166_t
MPSMLDCASQEEESDDGDDSGGSPEPADAIAGCVSSEQ